MLYNAAKLPIGSRRSVHGVEVVPTREAMSKLLTSPGRIVRLRESGREGDFKFDNSDLSTQVAADPQQGVYVAPSSDTTGASGAWVRIIDRFIYPEWFGAVQANVVSSSSASITDQTTLDASTDASVGLQAFFDFAFQVTFSQEYVYDWSGHWKITQPLYFARPLVNFNTLNVEYHGRRFICGAIHVGPVASQPGGVAMETVLTISCPYSHWGGHLLIHAGDRGTSNYADRRFKYGVRAMQAQQSIIDKLTVFSAKKDAIWADSQGETWTVRTGTAYEAGSTSKNNIGLRVNHLMAVNCGSTQLHGLTNGRSYSLTVSAKDQGSDPGETGTYSTTDAPNDNQQRTKLTVSSTAELTKGEFGQMRQEILPATYTSIAADNATSKFTWTAGDPVAAGLAVGQQFTLEDGSAVGANDGIGYTIMAFGGASNREITVYPAPTTEAAKVYTQLNSEWTLHRIDQVIDSTTFMVHPWVPDQHNSKWYHISGAAAKVTGNDAAGVHFGYLGTNNCGIGLNSQGQYSPSVDNAIIDVCDIGIAHGISHATVTLGLSVKAAHIEACTWDIVQCGALYGSMEVHSISVFTGNIVNLSGRATTSSVHLANDNLYYTTLVAGGTLLQSRLPGVQSGVDGLSTSNFTLTNHPSGNRADIASNSSLTCTLSFNEIAARMGLADAVVMWSGPSGAPTGTLTIALNAELTAKSWTIVGPTSIAAPATSVMLQVRFDAANKKVHVSRFNAV